MSQKKDDMSTEAVGLGRKDYYRRDGAVELEIDFVCIRNAQCIGQILIIETYFNIVAVYLS